MKLIPKLKLFLLICCEIIALPFAISQKDFIQIESNYVVSLFSFMETIKDATGTSISYRNYIANQLGEDEEFDRIVHAYIDVHMDYYMERSEFPAKRYSFQTVNDMIWIAASNSRTIDDLSERIIGLLPHNKHVEFIALLKKAAPFFDELIWSQEQVRISRIKSQLAPYKDEIEALYFKVTKFYGAEWDRSIPFKIILNPIPLDRGVSTAIPKGNALIVSFLSKHEEDYKGVLGVIVHEMCHILFGAQSLKKQRDIDDWFLNSSDSYNRLCYSYIDEGLATGIGNGWAYEKIFNEVDTASWYNNRYINGFAKAIFPELKRYLDEGIEIDKEFADFAIASFKATFPEAIREVNVVLHEIFMYSNVESEQEVDYLSRALRARFEVRSQYMSTPIRDPETQETFGVNQTSKIFIIESDHEKSFEIVREHFQNERIKNVPNRIYSFEDLQSKSPVIIIHIDDLDQIEKALDRLMELKYLKNGKRIYF